MSNISKILGVISIILGIVLIILTWRFPFLALGGMLSGMGILEGLIGLTIYISAIGGFIISGIGLIKQKKWAAILFTVLIILLGIYLIVGFKVSSSMQMPQGLEKRLEEEMQKDFQEFQIQSKYLKSNR